MLERERQETLDKFTGNNRTARAQRAITPMPDQAVRPVRTASRTKATKISRRK